MSYHIYTTEGYVLKGIPTGEADKYFQIFTKELGLIFANAKSVRSIKSKLSPSLRDFSSGEFSFIKGKNRWKITHAVSPINYYDLFREDKDKLLVCGRVFAFLPVCIAGEEINKTLFTVVDSAFTFLKNSTISKEQIFLFECMLMLRILFHLGYVAPSPEYKEILEDERWDDAVFEQALILKPKLVREINHALKESQMSL